MLPKIAALASIALLATWSDTAAPALAGLPPITISATDEGGYTNESAHALKATEVIGRSQA